ncbi:hypothetical protein [Actinophytocola gossypii]|uniref:Uncharacterized protein n=1 Tax=Actinophytocola gossypii TaxID=2812003 RepID=A0ABT2JD34_9PSEU|nr:hypothetical protein [Actinophytocola gossypii]MCT2585780.1 hypothetical protein [Actinophytocola gossypii]
MLLAGGGAGGGRLTLARVPRLRPAGLARLGMLRGLALAWLLCLATLRRWTWLRRRTRVAHPGLARSGTLWCRTRLARLGLARVGRLWRLARLGLPRLTGLRWRVSVVRAGVVRGRTLWARKRLAR